MTGSRSTNWLEHLFSRAEAGLERLEDRQLLSGAPDLGASGVWTDWGTTQNGSTNKVAALRGSYLVTFSDYLGNDGAILRAREIATRLGIQPEVIRPIGRGGWAEITTHDQVTFEAATRVAHDLSGIVAIEPNQIYRTNAVPNDPRYAQQYALRNTGQVLTLPGGGLDFGTAGADISAEAAWDITIGSRNTIVAVIDTGVDYNHEDLAANMWHNPGEIASDGVDNDGNGFVDDFYGYDFADLDPNPLDNPFTGGHGTLVAGCIGAVGNNGVGVTGVNWAVSIMALKIAREIDGQLTNTAIVASHDYATMMRQRGVNVVASNNSYGVFFFDTYQQTNQSQAEQAAIQRFINSGGIFVASAGNSGTDNDTILSNFPAAYNINGVIAVAATNNDDALAGFSSYGAQTVDFAAPGVAVLTTAAGGGYAYVNGTSFSSPITAGAVALLKTYKPNASAVEVREALINSVDPLPSLQGRVRSGGRLNIARALQIIGATGPVVNAFSPGSITGQFIPGTSTPLNTLSVTFSRDINPSLLSNAGVTLVGPTGNVTIASVLVAGTDPRTVNITLNLSAFSPQRLPVGTYTLTLNQNFFKDTSGNFLNGTSTSGSNAVIGFRVVAGTGDNEPNDTIALATDTGLASSGTINYTGITVGNGVFGGAAGVSKDVDFYKINLPRGGEIISEITARRRTGGSTLDSVIRLFNASGVQLAVNDQFNGDDSFIDFFVATGGPYYIAVSGFSNALYNPNVAGSGAGSSVGVYDLRVNVQLVNDDVSTFTSAANSIAGQPAFPINIPRGGEPGPPLADQGTTSASINVADSRQILDVNVTLSLLHTWDADLTISLICPDNTTVLLFDRRGSSGQNLTNTIFDDEASQPISTGFAPFAGNFRPEVVTGRNGLGDFDGKIALGTWTLVIVDNTPIHTGQLLSWKLDFLFQNNIFGPFESNDTIPTAKTLDELNGTGTANRAAFLGDGGFGSRDRDIFRFTADAGTTLTATITAQGQFDSILRLFDANGSQLLISNLLNSRNSRVDGYVFAVGGTFYIGISEANNPAYDPFSTTPGSSNPGLSTGNYTVDVALSAGVGDGANVLTGSNLTVGLDTTGLFSTTDTAGARTGWRFAGTEFLGIAGATIPDQFYGLTSSGNNFTNFGPGAPNGLSTSLVVRNDAGNNSATAKGTFNGLRIQRDISFSQGDSFFSIDVYLTNTSATPATNIFWMEAFNPQQGLLRDSIAATRNDLDPTKPYGSASYFSNDFQQGLTVSLGAPSADTRAKVNVIGSAVTVRDAQGLDQFARNDPDNATSDSRLGITYNLGSLGQGATTRMRYFVFFGTSPALARAMFDQMDSGSGTGFLTASVSGSGTSTVITTNSPAPEALQTAVSGQTAPTLPFKLYYPEGFFGDNIYTFVPISNPNDQATRVVVIARYEAQYNLAGQISNGPRDQLISDLTIAGNSRGGLTLTTPDLFRAGGALAGRANSSYALEIRSERPVSAIFSHYDLALLPRPEAVGEAFTSQTNATWSFGKVSKGADTQVQDYVLWYNTTSTDTVVLTTFYPLSGGTRTYEVGFVTPAFRRGGLEINRVQVRSDPNDPSSALIPLPDGDYGVVVQAPVQLVASLTHYDRTNIVAEGAIGNNGIGSTTGATPQGEVGTNSTGESIGVLNANSQSASVRFTFLFNDGSAYRTSLAVSPNSYGTLDVSSLTNFPTGLAYATYFDSNVAVSVNSLSNAFGDQLSSATSDRAYTLWGFGEGFHPADGSGHPGVTEYLRLYNPSNADTVVEITISYDGTPGSETFRRTLPARRVTELNIDQFITGTRRTSDAYFGTTVKAAAPIVAYMAHYDRFFPGAFGTLGTPLGLNRSVT